MNLTAETKIKKAHIALMRHPETCLYSGIFLMGKSEIVEDIPTACTNGRDKLYGRAFIDSLTQEEITGIVLHENLHVTMKHIPRFRKLMKTDGQTINAAMDYVVNDIIEQLQDKKLCKLPDSKLWDPKFRDWSVLEVYDFLKTGQDKDEDQKQKGRIQGQGGQGSGQPEPKKSKDSQGREQVVIRNKAYRLEGTDQHDDSDIQEMELSEIKKFSEEINEALLQGGLLAGRFGANVPRVIGESLVKPVDWVAVLRDFVNQAIAGRQEYTFAKFNRQWLADDYYIPGTEDETVGEVIIAIDTSGSIGSKELSEFAARVSEICEQSKPERVRVLWWDTRVHAEQMFEGQYTGIAKLLKPMGGGGTRAGAVSSYLLDKKINAECILMFTDGYVEDQVTWEVRVPTLWLVTKRNNFQPPAGGKLVKVDKYHGS